MVTEGLAERLYGRTAVENLVLEFMRRPADSPTLHRPLPVLQLVGPRGSGKTQLLDDLAEGLRGLVPFARLDFAAHPDITPRQVLRYLTFELNYWCARYGRLTFGRFLVGELVLSLELDDRDPRAARATVRTELDRLRHIDEIRTFLQKLADDAVAFVPPPVGQVSGVRAAAGYVPDLLLGGLSRVPRTRRAVLGRDIEWFARDAGARPGQPVDALVELNRSSRAKDPEQRAAADRTMWAAFLADVHQQFSGPHHKRPRYCPILLDNVDNEAGRVFLRRLDQSRRDELDGGTLGPVLVVATGLRPRREPAVPAEEAGYRAWAEDALTDGLPRDPDDWWYSVALRDLWPGEVVELARAERLPDVRRNSAFLYRLTEGHPYGTVLLARALAAELTESRERASTGATLRRILELAPPPAGESLSALLTARLLEDIDPALHAVLVTSAAAQSMEAAAKALVTRVDPRQIAAVGTAAGWIRHGKRDRRRLHPFLRRLLLTELAARPHGHEFSWTRTHELLREHSSRTGDQDAVLHHSLALERIQPVVLELRALLEKSEVEPRAWFGRFAAVTAAPNRLSRQETPGAALGRLTAWAEPTDLFTLVLARLTVAHWIQADPLGDPAGELTGIIKADFYQLSAFFPRGIEIFIREAERTDRPGGDGDV